MTHIDLFTGIGGFVYAAQQVWGKEYHNVFFCENNRFCQEVIKKHFGKDSVIYADIREVTADSYRDRLQEQREKQQAGGDRQFSEITADAESWKSREQKTRDGREDFGRRGKEGFDLLTGGFPCQPFSCAGKQRGTNDDRYLWPEMFRVIKDFKPRWVVAENVRGLVNIQDGVVFEQACLDLEGEGYEVQPFIVPAVAVNAPHRRDRVWIVAHCTSERPNSGECDRQERHIQNDNGIGEIGANVTNTKTRRLEKPGFEPGKQASSSKFRNKFYNWQTGWLEIATKLCGVDDGISCELDGFKLSKAQHRVERLKALGNAIVPQVVIEIMKAIKYAEER